MSRQRIVLATYMDQFQAEPIGLIQRTVVASRHIDELRAYNRCVLPESIQNSLNETLKKPWVILDVMKDMGDNDILVYSDAANIIHENMLWKKWKGIISKSSAFFLVLGDRQSRVNNTFMGDIYYRTKIFPALHLNSGLFFLKKSGCDLVEEWYAQAKGLSISDVESEDIDKTILSNVIYNHLDDNKIKIFVQD